MDNTNILRTDLLDLIFQGRNKDYGAYELRRNHDRYLKRALLFALLAPLVIWAFNNAKRNNNAEGPRVRITSMQTTAVKIKPDEKEKQPKQQQKKPETAAKAFVAQYQIKQDDSVKKTMASQVDLIDKRIDAVDVDGKKFTGIADTVTHFKGDDNSNNGNGDVSDFGKQEIDASFPGGDAKWLQYLERNANGQVATDNDAPVGTYTAIIQFSVDENGNVSDVRALTNNGYGIEEEAIRVIKKGPKWVPAFQNGHLVKSFRKQPITFRVDSE